MDYVCTWKLALLGPTGQMREILGCLRDKPDVPTSWSHWLQVPGNGGETEAVSVKRNRERRQCPWLLRELPFKRGRSCRTGKSGWRSECFGRKRPHLRLPLTQALGLRPALCTWLVVGGNEREARIYLTARPLFRPEGRDGP